MSISEQIKEIKACAYAHEASGDAIYGTANILYQAADTIKSLSAKLADMERSAEDCGGWITDRVPTREECGDFGKEFAVTVDANGIKTLVMKYVYETVRGKEVSRWKWIGRISTWKVIALKPLPEPYRGH